MRSDSDDVFLVKFRAGASNTDLIRANALLPLLDCIISAITHSVVSLKQRKAAIFTSCVTSSDREFERHDGGGFVDKIPPKLAANVRAKEKTQNTQK